MIQRTKEGVGKFARGVTNFGAESLIAVGGAFIGDKVLETTHFLNLPGGVGTEFAQMSAFPLFALAKWRLDGKFNPLVIPSVLASGGAVLGWEHFHSQDTMLPLYAAGAGVGLVAELLWSRRGKKAAKPQAH